MTCFLCFFAKSIVNAVPLLEPSQIARIASALFTIILFLIIGADLPYLLYSGRNSVNFIPRSSAKRRAIVSTPFAPPETISVVDFGMNGDKSKELTPRLPIIASFISSELSRKYTKICFFNKLIC